VRENIGFRERERVSAEKEKEVDGSGDDNRKG
jgi:hypothetical protein